MKSIWWRNKYIKIMKNEIEKILGKNILKKQMTELSGIEIQKILYLRWFFYHPQILVITNPFHGKDINLAQVIESEIERMLDKKISIVIISQKKCSEEEKGDILYIEV